MESHSLRKIKVPHVLFRNPFLKSKELLLPICGPETILQKDVVGGRGGPSSLILKGTCSWFQRKVFNCRVNLLDTPGFPGACRNSPSGTLHCDRDKEWGEKNQNGNMQRENRCLAQGPSQCLGKQGLPSLRTGFECEQST